MPLGKKKSNSESSSSKKGILKSSSKDSQSQIKRRKKKTAKFDEKNISETYHPLDKDYGHDRISEPPTPYHHLSPERGIYSTPVDAVKLSEKLFNLKSSDQSSDRKNENSDDDEQSFAEKMRQHYKNEFKASKSEEPSDGVMKIR